MPKTTKRWDHRQNIGGVFTERADADQAIEDFLIVHTVKHPGPIIDIFDENKAEYNPDGSHNLREDVAGLTVGAAAGTALVER